jgi:hypothetical protein
MTWRSTSLPIKSVPNSHVGDMKRGFYSILEPTQVTEFRMMGVREPDQTKRQKVSHALKGCHRIHFIPNQLNVAMTARLQAGSIVFENHHQEPITKSSLAVGG